jgi:hypothetical protein
MFFISLPLHTKISPGWHSRISQIASNVENRMAFALPVFNMDRLAVDPFVR